MKKFNVRWQLVAYDFILLLLVDLFVLKIFGSETLSYTGLAIQTLISAACIFGARFSGSVYRQIWRYGNVQSYLRFIIADALAFAAYLILENVLPIEHISFLSLVSVCSVNLIFSLFIRMMYRYAYNLRNTNTTSSKLFNFLLRLLAGTKVENDKNNETGKIKVAIVGAGHLGVALAEELINNETSPYSPRCFVDISQDKVNRKILSLSVYPEGDATLEKLKLKNIGEVFFALPSITEEEKQRLYHYYSQAGYKVKVYDFPFKHVAGEKRLIREFDIEELLFRKPIVIHNDKTTEYYKNKVVLITGGGGSIGSELCRQLAKMSPKKIIILDIYENGAYDIQQELRIAYKNQLDISIEIASITNRRAMERVFEEYHPEIVINAAAHKHVPLMEHNCIEAVENNVFGTKNLVELAEKYDAERFMMVSTDKAVNPTNVMGATKRVCELIVKNASLHGKLKCSATRFGNVLGSAGSVIPLFKKQIAVGGPITITDKRIIRYFMTIPEASQLVLESGAMAKNGELFVLDMGQPVKIYDLAKNMIKLSGAFGVDIIETGLRPGEKLYEELLIKTETLSRTENSLIFIEKEDALCDEVLGEKLRLLTSACEGGDDDAVRDVLKQVVDTYKSPEEVNLNAEKSDEMNSVKMVATV